MSPPRSGADRALLAQRPGGAERPRWQERRDDHREALNRQVRSAGVHRAPPQRTTVGEYTALCVLIDFPDRPQTIAQQEVESFCNQPGYRGFGNQGSVADYFRDASNGRLEVRTKVLPYYTAQQPFTHYDDADVPWPQRTQELIAEALKHHRERGESFAELTADDQQAVFAINVFHAGAQAATFSRGLWPHAWRLDAPLRLAAGRNALDYQLSAIGEQLSLGVYCHENGHMLCEFPDLYDRETNRRGVGRYCLMCLGCHADARNPTLPGAYLRWRAGWGDAQGLAAGEQRLPPSSSNRFLIHRRSGVDTEYFLLENRRRDGRDAALAASGLAVWHIDELGDNFEPGRSMAGHQHAECRLLQADGLTELDDGSDDGDGTDLFGPGPDPVFVDGTARAPRWRDGTPAGLQIHSLRNDGDDLVFTVELS
jgi:M6 family metalloprotease-like protein